jgi:hypothetical protein
MIETMHAVRCDHCGELVDVHGADWPPVQVTRDAVAGDPRSFLIIGRHGEQAMLLHSCADQA